MNEPAPERNNRRERGPQAALIGCADARLTSVVRQCGQTRPPYLGATTPGIGRTRTDGLWQHRIADSFNHNQSNEPKQNLLWCPFT